jgi:thiamine pyrophosphokinase
MRGLIFTGGDAPDIRMALRFFSPGSYVIAADSGLTCAEAAGLVPDLIVGDMDSLDDLRLLEKYPEDKIRRFPRDKDETDTELALDLMHEHGVNEIVLVGGSGGRFDHFFALRELYETDLFPDYWIGKESVVVAVSPKAGNSMIRLSGLTSGTPVSVFAVGKGIHACRSTGLHWPLGDLLWDSGAYSLSNRGDAGFCTVEAVSGSFIVIVPLDETTTITRF